MSADPLTVHGLGADLNAYAYVSGGVLSSVDPVGLEEKKKGQDLTKAFGNESEFQKFYLSNPRPPPKKAQTPPAPKKPKPPPKAAPPIPADPDQQVGVKRSGVQGGFGHKVLEVATLLAALWNLEGPGSIQTEGGDPINGAPGGGNPNAAGGWGWKVAYIAQALIPDGGAGAIFTTARALKRAMKGTKAVKGGANAVETAAKRNPGCSGGLCPCFIAGTPVVMADGTLVPIEEVQVGDWILADDPTDDSPAEAAQVEGTRSSSTRRLVEIGVEQPGGSEIPLVRWTVSTFDYAA